MSLISIAEALRRVLASVEGHTGPELVSLREAAGRTLAADLVAHLSQPPFAASAMDGYAVRASDAAGVPAILRVIGESVAGRRHEGAIGAGEAVRIFTGAPLPDGADTVVIQEDATRDGSDVVLREAAVPGRHIRQAGLDFRAGEVVLGAGERLDASRLALAAAAGFGSVPVHRKPRVGILATGDELVCAGEQPGPDGIVASNPHALAAIADRAGGDPVDLGIARDTLADLARALDVARRAEIDLLVTLGGASVGDHDLVGKALAAEGLKLGFWRVAIRPGKPLMHGRLGPTLLLGLPGNPVSSIVCGVLFVVPAIRALLGDPQAGRDPTEGARLAAELPANDGRQDYLRASLEQAEDGFWLARAAPRQDSSMLKVLTASAGLIVRPPYAPAASAGDLCRVIRLDRFC